MTSLHLSMSRTSRIHHQSTYCNLHKSGVLMVIRQWSRDERDTPLLSDGRQLPLPIKRRNASRLIASTPLLSLTLGPLSAALLLLQMNLIPHNCLLLVLVVTKIIF